MLIGHTGTGKELIARAIHNFSVRVNEPFIAIDCGALPDTLLESELFGHKRGAYTGAGADRKGLFQEAHGGTLFLDEINNLHPDMQSKMLRVLQENEIRPIGGNVTIPIDVRIIAASSMPLKSLVETRQFREDLFFRLHVYPIHIPDLSERRDDIPLLARHFLEQFTHKQNKKASHFQEVIVEFMKRRNWKGNIRELENFIERMITVTPPNALTINADYFPMDLKRDFENFRQEVNAEKKSESIKKRLSKYEAEIIRDALIECGWNQSKAARKLQTSESNIRNKISQFNIRKE